MRDDLYEFSPDLTIPGFDVKVGSDRLSCQVKSKDGRYEFSAEIPPISWNSGSFAFKYIKFSGPKLPYNLKQCIGSERNAFYNKEVYADDVITQVANSLKLMDKLSSEGFSAEMEENWLVLSHPSKPNYELRMSLANVQRIVGLKNNSLYTRVEYRGPAYNDRDAYRKWQLNSIDNSRLIVINKDFEELAQELKTRFLKLGEPDSRITKWVDQEIEKELLPQGFTFTPKPEEGIVEFSHPVGLSGTLSWGLFSGNFEDLDSKYPNPHFPTDIENERFVLFTCNLPNTQYPYTNGWKANSADSAISDFRGILAIVLVYQEVCNAWKSDILEPRIENNSLQLVNTRLPKEKAIAFELAVRYNKLRLWDHTRQEYRDYKFSNAPTVVNTKEITQAILAEADQHVQEFIRAQGPNTAVPEVDI